MKIHYANLPTGRQKQYKFNDLKDLDEYCKIKDTIKLDIYSDPFEELDDFRKDHIDCNLSIEDEYGDHTLYLSGWRNTSEKERNDLIESIKNSEEKEKIFKQRQLEIARKVLKEAGEL